MRRSIKRWPGGATVAVVVRGRPWAAVQADLVEGVVAANHLAGPAADRARAALWEAIVEPEPPRRGAARQAAAGRQRPPLRVVEAA